MPQQRFTGVEAVRGKAVVGRLLRGSDLILGLEGVCDQHGINYGAIQFAYGSLARAQFKVLSPSGDDQTARLIDQLVDDRVEFFGGQGLICRDGEGKRATHLHGSVSDRTGRVTGGHFVAGMNPIYNNLDYLVVELGGVELVRRYDQETGTVEMEVGSLEQ
ncbi:MAG: PPC domain-containing DNA-binding protein [Acidimicrobiales bacterium]